MGTRIGRHDGAAVIASGNEVRRADPGELDELLRRAVALPRGLLAGPRCRPPVVSVALRLDPPGPVTRLAALHVRGRAAAVGATVVLRTYTTVGSGPALTEVAPIPVAELAAGRAARLLAGHRRFLGADHCAGDAALVALAEQGSGTVAELRAALVEHEAAVLMDVLRQLAVAS